jgi:hypothetical protein
MKNVFHKDNPHNLGDPRDETLTLLEATPAVNWNEFLLTRSISGSLSTCTWGSFPTLVPSTVHSFTAISRLTYTLLLAGSQGIFTHSI